MSSFDEVIIFRKVLVLHAGAPVNDLNLAHFFVAMVSDTSFSRQTSEHAMTFGADSCGLAWLLLSLLDTWWQWRRLEK